MENKEKKTRSRLGTACKVISAVYMVAYGLMWLYTLTMVLNYATTLIWTTLLQLLTEAVPGLTLWAVGVLLDRQKEDKGTLAEIKALLAAGGSKADGDNDVAELETRLETALEENTENAEEAPKEPEE